MTLSFRCSRKNTFKIYHLHPLAAPSGLLTDSHFIGYQIEHNTYSVSSVKFWIRKVFRITCWGSDEQKTTTMRFWLMYTFAITLVASVEFVVGGCREQERNSCEIICQTNTTTNRTECNLRAIVILPKMDKVEASLPRVINE